MNTEPQKLEAVWLEICRITAARKVQPLNSLPSTWELKIDERWRLTINGHGHKIENVPPYSCMAYFNGWPFACFDPHGGEFGYGEIANIDTFLEALRGVQ